MKFLKESITINDNSLGEFVANLYDTKYNEILNPSIIKSPNYKIVGVKLKSFDEFDSYFNYLHKLLAKYDPEDKEDIDKVVDSMSDEDKEALLYHYNWEYDSGNNDITEELRVWGDEEISAQNDLVKWKQALEDFLENNNIEYDRVKWDVFDYGTNIVIVNPEDIEEVAQEIEDHYGFKTTIEDNNIYVDVTEEYEDEYGDIKTRVSKRYHESYNDEGYTLQYLNEEYEDPTKDPNNDDTLLKRVASYNEFDNGHVLHHWEHLKRSEAEELARKKSLEDPNDIYYVAYDNFKYDGSDYRYKNGKKYLYNDLEHSIDESIESK